MLRTPVFLVSLLLLCARVVAQKVVVTHIESGAHARYKLPVAVTFSTNDSTVQKLTLKDVKDGILTLGSEFGGNEYRVPWQSVRWLRLHRRSEPVLFALFAGSAAAFAVFGTVTLKYLGETGNSAKYRHKEATLFWLPLTVVSLSTALGTLGNFPPKFRPGDWEISKLPFEDNREILNKTP